MSDSILCSGNITVSFVFFHVKQAFFTISGWSSWSTSVLYIRTWWQTWPRSLDHLQVNFKKETIYDVIIQLGHRGSKFVTNRFNWVFQKYNWKVANTLYDFFAIRPIYKYFLCDILVVKNSNLFSLEPQFLQYIFAIHIYYISLISLAIS